MPDYRNYCIGNFYWDDLIIGLRMIGVNGVLGTLVNKYEKSFNEHFSEKIIVVEWDNGNVTERNYRHFDRVYEFVDGETTHSSYEGTTEKDATPAKLGF